MIQLPDNVGILVHRCFNWHLRTTRYTYACNKKQKPVLFMAVHDRHKWRQRHSTREGISSTEKIAERGVLVFLPTGHFSAAFYLSFMRKHLNFMHGKCLVERNCRVKRGLSAFPSTSKFQVTPNLKLFCAPFMAILGFAVERSFCPQVLTDGRTDKSSFPASLVCFALPKLEAYKHF